MDSVVRSHRPVEELARHTALQQVFDCMSVGLGLAVARGFVDALGGELTVDDTPGGGATLIFTFKVAA